MAMSAEELRREERTRPFRFKAERTRSSSPRVDRYSSGTAQNESKDDCIPAAKQYSRRSHERHHHAHHSHSRSHTNHDREHASAKEDALPNMQLPPDQAFRESLFDALADDEGAAFWESVYGQPIHTYSQYYHPSGHDEPEAANPDTLEKMSEEDYVAHVRAKMWEKSHGYILEERERRKQDRARYENEKERKRKEWTDQMEHAMQRNEARQDKKRWKSAWEKYNRAWEHQTSTQPLNLSSLPWPVESLKAKDAHRADKVEEFFSHAPSSTSSSSAAPTPLPTTKADILKRERVRWHPDKMQQRAGSDGLGTETMALVTAVFQVVDRLWRVEKDKKRE